MLKWWTQTWAAHTPLERKIVAPAVSSCRVGFRACPHPKTECSKDLGKGAPTLALCSVVLMGLAKVFSCLHYSSISPPAQSSSSFSLPQLVIPIKYPACQTLSQQLLMENLICDSWYQEESQKMGNRCGFRPKPLTNEDPITNGRRSTDSPCHKVIMVQLLKHAPWSNC